MHKLIRPIVYKVIPRFVIGLILALLWNRYVNVSSYFSIFGYAFFIIGILFFAIAWVSYLRLDGLKFNFLGKKSDREGKKKRKFRFMMADFMSEEPSPLDDLDENEEMKANFIANLAAGLCFLLPAVVSLIIKH